MPLTEEEKSAIEMYRTSQYAVAKIIDRLLAENEELRIKSLNRTMKDNLDMASMSNQLIALQTQLDAIKKAAKGIQEHFQIYHDSKNCPVQTIEIEVEE